MSDVSCSLIVIRKEKNLKSKICGERSARLIDLRSRRESSTEGGKSNHLKTGLNIILLTRLSALLLIRYYSS